MGLVGSWISISSFVSHVRDVVTESGVRDLLKEPITEYLE